ncbi:MAG: sodium:alanine symporter family protein [Clostridia bacterium]|nr:sodium:alanine symporter family protein [Clostridia bacterium]
MEWLEKAVDSVNTYLSGYILVFLLVGVGLFYSIKTKFVQVRCLGEGFKKAFSNKKEENGEKKGLSSFQALATAVAAQVGTGNIVGACGAILVGGPGAIFWMWIIAFFGMATNYAEAVLAQKTKVIDENGEVHGGPVYYIKKAFTGKFGKFLAGFFAVAIIIALGFIGSMVQSNSIVSNISGVFTSFGANADTVSNYMWIIGLVVALLAGFIFIGGIKRIASVTEKLVPIMAILYIVGGLLVLCVNITNVPSAIGAIFKYAFTPQSIIGGGLGSAIVIAIQKGAQRGLFSNEAGMGSTPHAHAQADVKDPHDQGVTAMVGVFIDTFVVLTMTALVVISTLYVGDGALASITGEAIDATGSSFTELAKLGGYSDGNMVQKAFQLTFTKLFGGNASIGNAVGSIFVAVCLFFFAFSTIISWNFFGKINFNYLFGKKATIVYSAITIVCVFLGSIGSNTLVWGLSDLFNNLMVIPNVIALIALYGMVTEKFKKNNEISVSGKLENK